jgi:hypothetical protein
MFFSHIYMAYSPVPVWLRFTVVKAQGISYDFLPIKTAE